MPLPYCDECHWTLEYCWNYQLRSYGWYCRRKGCSNQAPEREASPLTRAHRNNQPEGMTVRDNLAATRPKGSSEAAATTPR